MLDSAEVNTVSVPLPKEFIGQQKVDKDPVVQKLHLNTRIVLCFHINNFYGSLYRVVKTGSDFKNS